MGVSTSPVYSSECLTSVVLKFGLLSRHDTSDATEDLRRLQGRRNKVLVAFRLLHVYPELERAVDLAVLHKVSPCDAWLLTRHGRHLALLNVLGEIELNGSQCDAFASSRASAVFLHDLELDATLL